jgi:hypothetical protein
LFKIVKQIGKDIEAEYHYKKKQDGSPYKRPSEVIAHRRGVRVKECTKCRQWKPWDAYRMDKVTKDGKHSSCRTCERKYFKVYDNSPRGRERFERRKRLEEEVIQTELAYHEFVRDYFNRRCAITGAMEDIVLDHLIPLSWGSYGNEQGNLIPVSSTFNKIKRSRSIFDVIEEQDPKARERFYSSVLPFVARENDMSVEEYIHMYKTIEKSRRP